MSETTANIKKGTCPVCGSACFIKAHLTEGKITKVETDQESLFGHLCERGANAIEYHYHPSRLNYPLKRTGARGEAKWKRIGWDQAMDEIAGKLDAIRNRYGPEAVLVLGGSPHGPGDPAAWKCLIDEVEIYNRALNGAEIQAIFNAGVAGKCKVNLATSVPAMTEWGLVLMSLFFGGSGFYLLRRRRTV